MKPINLLPEDYVVGRRRRMRKRNMLALSLVVGVLGLAWMAAALMQKRSIDHRLNEARQALASLDETWRGIEAKQQLVAQRLHARAELDAVRDVLPWPAMLALICRDFPQEGALSSLMIYVPDEAVSRPAEPRRVKAAREQAISMPDRVRVTMEGVAASDVVVTAYARKLSETGIFEQVRIEGASQVVINAQSMHQFRLSAMISFSGANRTPMHDWRP